MFKQSTFSFGKLSVSAALQTLEQLGGPRSLNFQRFSTAALCNRFDAMGLRKSSPISINNGDIITNNTSLVPSNPFLVPSRHFAARKGTRTRKEKQKVKKEVVKKQFIFKSIRKQMEMPYKKQRPFDDSHYPEPVDNVYFVSKFRKQSFPFAECVQNLRETHHPTVYNLPDAALNLRVNIDLTYPNRPNKFQDGWRSVIEMKEPFLLSGMIRPSVMAFCIEDNDYINEVLKAGADVAGSKELIKSIQEGQVDASIYEYIVAHPTIVPDLTVIRGLIKKKFPMIKNRTVSTDLVTEIKRLKGGIKIKVEKNDREPDFGFFETPIGKLDMSTEDLEGNFLAILRDTIPRRVPGKTPEKFVISCLIRTPLHQGEVFSIDLTPYLGEFAQTRKHPSATTPSSQDDDLDEKSDEAKEKVSAAASQ